MLAIAVPVTLQNLLFSSFTLVDTLMIGALGDTPLAAVGMAGKWSWFLGIVLFGFTSGAAVFIAQYFGAGDTRGIHRTYGLMSMGTMAAALLFMAAAMLFPERIVSLFTRDPEAVEIASVYLRIIALSYPFQALRRSAGTLLQSTQQVIIPFIAAVCSVATNVCLNAVLIFGLLGFPALGVAGAAIASVIAAAVDAAVIFFAGCAKKTLLRAPLSAMLDIDRAFAIRYLKIGAPAMFNETTWALGVLCYSAIFGHMSTQAYAAITVVKSIEELTSVAIFGLGSSCAVMIGSYIGRGDIPSAKRCAGYHIRFTLILSLIIGGGVLCFREGIMSLFGVSAQVRSDALAVLAIYACEMALRNMPYMMVVGIFRAGGDTKFGLIIDIMGAYLIGIPLTAAAGLWLGLSVPATYLIMYLSEDLVKTVIYGRHLLSGRWIRPVMKEEV